MENVILGLMLSSEDDCLLYAPTQGWISNLQCNGFMLNLVNFHNLKTAQDYPNF